jgi:hypothetical protein
LHIGLFQEINMPQFIIEVTEEKILMVLKDFMPIFIKAYLNTPITSVTRLDGSSRTRLDGSSRTRLDGTGTSPMPWTWDENSNIYDANGKKIFRPCAFEEIGPGVLPENGANARYVCIASTLEVDWSRQRVPE